MQGIQLARKGKWNENGRLWQSAEFARNKNAKKMNLQRKDIAKNGTFPTVNVRIPVTLSSVEVQATITCLNFELLTSH